MPEGENKVILAAGKLYSDTVNILKGTRNHMNVGRSFSRQARDLHSAIARILKTTTDRLNTPGDESDTELIATFLPKSYKAPEVTSDLTEAAGLMFNDLKDLVVQTHAYMLDGNTVHGEVLNTLCLVSEAMRKCYETIGVAPNPNIPEEKAIGDAMAEFLPKKKK